MSANKRVGFRFRKLSIEVGLNLSDMNSNTFLLLLFILPLYPVLVAGQIVDGQVDSLIRGSIDFHIHSAPDVVKRSINDLEAARSAAEVGMQAIVLKSHVASTAGRASLVNEIVAGIQVYGGITLNTAVGGINPEAVRTMIKISPKWGKVVWLPTIDAAKIEVIRDGILIPEMIQVLKLIAEHDLVLATGHLSPSQIKIVVQQAKNHGIQYILGTHALAREPNLDLDMLRWLTQHGVIIELTYLSYLMRPDSDIDQIRSDHQVGIKEMVESINVLGAEHFLLSTDLGKSKIAHPVDGLRDFIQLLLQGGCTPTQLEVMLKRNPKQLLGILDDED